MNNSKFSTPTKARKWVFASREILLGVGVMLNHSCSELSALRNAQIPVLVGQAEVAMIMKVVTLLIGPATEASRRGDTMAITMLNRVTQSYRHGNVPKK